MSGKTIEEVMAAGPAGRWLARLRQHAREDHGATPGDYGQNVRAWHKRAHPDCQDEPAYESAVGTPPDPEATP